ncbi:hypothetical protein CMESO_23 (nucleomorph) [Chroomonas mesostigmatica CCMP1168]|uniref:BZIP domain-containing protein n=1 Tax=Chroomonas mesostigmatica CCMP1168 TaxID=1195612 RepID=J7G571_9CRYP|nr:hypothetical protein CMESO_23 [Chroomonas mesostigmatica CCMP1168]|mmetsp:Transcript_65912/g.162236  ORF Transcript_65912/g.162236 Transcript_65912/m.162236 type:complete len:205 (-) Transcript_65912:1016-1630(-)
MSILEADPKNYEKTLYFLFGIPFFDSWKKFSNDDFDSFREIRGKKNSDHNDFLGISRFQTHQNTHPLIYKGHNNFTCFLNQQSQDFNFSLGKQSDYNLNDTTKEFFSGKRRTRRKFKTDGERKYARLLKNRRTAEESRQRRIQKMKELENYTANFEEIENKLKEEIEYLKDQNNFQSGEIQFLKNQNVNQAAEIFNLKNKYSCF